MHNLELWPANFLTLSSKFEKCLIESPKAHPTSSNEKCAEGLIIAKTSYKHYKKLLNLLEFFDEHRIIIRFIK